MCNAENPASLLWSSADEFDDLGSIGWRSGGCLEIPLEIGLFEGCEGDAFDGEIRGVAELSPLRRGQETPVAGVAEFFNCVDPIGGDGFVVRHGAIDEQKVSAGFQDPGDFANESCGRSEVVRGDAAGDQVECGIGVGKLLGGMERCGDLNAALCGELLRAFKHGRREIACGHVPAEFCEGHGGVATSGCDIERAAPRDSGERFDDIRRVGQNMRGAVVVALAVELFFGGKLGGVELHRAILCNEGDEVKSSEGSTGRAKWGSVSASHA